MLPKRNFFVFFSTNPPLKSEFQESELEFLGRRPSGTLIEYVHDLEKQNPKGGARAPLASPLATGLANIENFHFFDFLTHTNFQ